MIARKLLTSQEPVLPKVPFTACPIRASLGVFGKKWALLILRDLAFLKLERFSQILRNNAGLTPRALSIRLRDLEREGLIKRLTNSKGKREVKYRLTTKGNDCVPILTAFIQYGMLHHANRVFDDGKPRELREVFPQIHTSLLGNVISYAQENR